ncbi:aminotransferase DegT [Desulfomarina profundi]|uniref:GDP-perosamine synthase n=1 Tax=Desulfomarina profundi TaxID=2772557 RepID=A0A8D5FG15_9BACT|nr:LegC family aminotransferase [Desulfomarina profundi]BCL60658.1 aminotransferase DegT [Desulfomarina profundi]
MFKSFVDCVRDIYRCDAFIPLHEPRFTGREKEYVMETINSTFVSSVGSFVEKFERLVADYTGCRYAVATVNGTAALHMSLLLADVGQNDEVITQSLTFAATCAAIRYCGANPVFVDVDRTSLGLSPESLLEFLHENTEKDRRGLCRNRQSGKIIRACVPMHTFGHPARLTEIAEICSEYNLVLIEDAAESLGSMYKNRHTGRFGKMSVFSFNGNKIITTGGGGMIVTDDESLAVRAKHLTTTAKKKHPWLYEHDEVGFNYRMPNLNAALGCAQMEQLKNFVIRKRELASEYTTWAGQQRVELVTEPVDAYSNYWLNALLLKDRNERDSFLEFTNGNGVMTRPVWKPLHTLPMYKRDFSRNLQNTNWLAERLVNIPSSVVLNDE